MIIVTIIITINGIFMPYYEIDSFSSTKAMNLTPAGEITMGMKITQPLILPEINNNNIVVEIPFTTYSRKNHGNISISLEQDLKSQNFVINSVDKDETKKFIFDNKNFKSGNATLIISGIDTFIGDSPTIWLTNDTINKKKANINGINSNLTLHMSLKIQTKEPPHFLISDNLYVFPILIITYLLIIVLLGIYFTTIQLK